MKQLSAFLLALLLGGTAPAWADDYSATTTIDLTTLTFSGVTTVRAATKRLKATNASNSVSILSLPLCEG